MQNFYPRHKLGMNYLMVCGLRNRSPEVRVLCLMKLSTGTLQNLPYFWNKKTQKGFFSFSFRANLNL